MMFYAILKKYGLPPSLVNGINKMYQNYHIHLKVGKNLEKIPYETGVQQGNNMALILFLAIMQAVMETLKKTYLLTTENPSFITS